MPASSTRRRARARWASWSSNVPKCFGRLHRARPSGMMSVGHGEDSCPCRNIQTQTVDITTIDCHARGFRNWS